MPTREVDLHLAGASATVRGRTFVYAWQRRGLEEPRPVLVSLDARGALVQTELAAGFADPVTLASEPDGLVVLSVPSTGSPVAQRLRVSPDGTVSAERGRAVQGLPRGWPSGLASNGRILVVLHRIALPDGSAGTPTLFVADLAASRVVRSDATGDLADAACAGTVCAAARIGPDSATFARLDDAGAERDAVSVPFVRECRELERVETETGVAWLARGAAPSAVALRDATPVLVGLDASAVPAEPGCGETLHPFDAAPWPGLTLGYRGPRAVVAWDPDGARIQPLGTLPSDAWERHLSSAFVDGTVEIAFTSSSGMVHSPTDADGNRRYFESHSFEGGEVALLRRTGGRWERMDVRPLAIAGVHGTMSEGYQPRVLRHGAHAAVLLLSESLGETGYFQPYREPCPSNRESVGAR